MILSGGPIRDIVPELAKSPMEFKWEAEHLKSDDEKWMYRAFQVALHAVGHTSPNPPVGCVIVANNQEISCGYTQEFGGAHAEVDALSKLTHNDPRLADATAYVTLEPCSHHGKTPPCIDLLRLSGIRRVVIAHQDPNPLVAGSGNQALRTFGIEVIENILQDAAALFYQPFFTYITQRRIYVAMKWAQSIDGCLSDDAGNSKWISNSVSRQYAHWLRQKYDAVLVGRNTFAIDQPKLSVRDIPSKFRPRQPVRIIFSSTQATQLLNAKNEVLNWHPPLGINACDVFSHFLVWLASEEFSRFNGKPIQSVMIEPGPKMLGYLLTSQLFDIIHCFVAPKFIGAAEGRPLFAEARNIDVKAQFVFLDDQLIEGNIGEVSNLTEF